MLDYDKIETDKLVELATSEIKNLSRGQKWKMSIPVDNLDSDTLLLAAITRLELENLMLKNALILNREDIQKLMGEINRLLDVTNAHLKSLERKGEI